jgi:alpha/beta superfamily hydrolase
MEPFYFGTPGRELFGVYHPPIGAPNGKGAVLCPPLFAEYFRSHASLRRLALRLASKGLHVLRFDYYGTGDSAGEFESTTPDDWQRDIQSAVKELEAISGAARMQVFGVRFGATLAARVALTLRCVDRVVLWDPISDGAAYVRELRDTHERLVLAHKLGPSDVADLNDRQELLGFRVSRRMIDEMEGIRLPACARLAARSDISTLIVSTERTCDRGLEGASALERVDVVHLDFDCDWTNHSDVVLYPHDLLRVLSDPT